MLYKFAKESEALSLKLSERRMHMRAAPKERPSPLSLAAGESKSFARRTITRFIFIKSISQRAR